MQRYSPLKAAGREAPQDVVSHFNAMETNIFQRQSSEQFSESPPTPKVFFFSIYVSNELYRSGCAVQILRLHCSLYISNKVSKAIKLTEVFSMFQCRALCQHYKISVNIVLSHHLLFP